MLEIDRLDGDNSWIDLEFVERKAAYEIGYHRILHVPQ